MARQPERWVLRSSILNRTRGEQPLRIAERVVELQKEGKTGKWAARVISSTPQVPQAEQQACAAAVLRYAEQLLADTDTVAPGSYRAAELLEEEESAHGGGQPTAS